MVTAALRRQCHIPMLRVSVVFTFPFHLFHSLTLQQQTWLKCRTALSSKLWLDLHHDCAADRWLHLAVIKWLERKSSWYYFLSQHHYKLYLSQSKYWDGMQRPKKLNICQTFTWKLLMRQKKKDTGVCFSSLLAIIYFSQRGIKSIW